jgi:hypothetical protein
MIYFQRDHLTIRQDESLDILISDWIGRVSSDEYRKGMELILQIVQEKNITKWLTISRNMKALSVNDQRWTNELFLREIPRSPLKKIARLLSDEIINQLIINTMVEHAQEIKPLPVAFAQFSDYETAIRWLMDDVLVK